MSLTTTHLGKYHRFTARMGGDNIVYVQPGANEKLNIDMNGGILSNAITSGSASQLFTSITTTDLLATNILATNITTTNLTGNSLTIPGTVSIINAGNATDVSSGGLIVSGGTGITGDVYMNGTLYNENQIAYIARNNTTQIISFVGKKVNFPIVIANQGPSGKTITFDGTSFTCRLTGIYNVQASCFANNTYGTNSRLDLLCWANGSLYYPGKASAFCNTPLSATAGIGLNVAALISMATNDVFYITADATGPDITIRDAHVSIHRLT